MASTRMRESPLPAASENQWDCEAHAATMRGPQALIALPSIVTASDLVVSCARRVAEHSPMPGIEVTQPRRRHVELNRMLNAEQMVLSACNTIVGDMLGSAAQRQLAAV
ncbi:hypothetical protein [Bradyrhizobium sp. NAS96.2]|uniref:hypothetical protein n=1 Tax=Bradyrhizobium sp. NAS96.2 TaxID=1680160 RepID=UPI00116143C5|nr:hypothetical protein [Bradyrhizobium sp. NAS96.2]